MSLIHNERWKLTATALNGVAIVMAATGFIVPIVNLSYGAPATADTWLLILISLAWFGSAVSLHLLARYVLGRLKE
jgi:hypothetical protein